MFILQTVILVNRENVKPDSIMKKYEDIINIFARTVGKVENEYEQQICYHYACYNAVMALKWQNHQSTLT